MSEKMIRKIVLQVKNQVIELIEKKENQKLDIFKLLIMNENALENKIEEYFTSKIISNDSLIKLFTNNKIELTGITFNTDDEIELLKKLHIIIFDNCTFNVNQLSLDDKKVCFKICTFTTQHVVSNCKTYGYLGTIFQECIFQNGVSFGHEKKYENSIFYNCVIKEKVFASNCIFNGKIFWNDIDNNHKVIDELNMTNCTFNGDFIINEINKDKNSEFIIKKLNLRDSKFNTKVKLFKCDIKNACFYNTRFSDLADFYGSTFSGLYIDEHRERAKDYLEIFEKADFEGICVFSKSTFNCTINFKYTKFLDKTIFRETLVNDILDLKDSIIKNSMNFLDIQVSSKKNLANRETARIIKDSFEQQNNIIEANKFYALEMQKMEEELKKADKVKISEWLIFKVHGLTSNHSQDWLLALFWILSLSFGLAFVNCVNEYLDTKLEYILIDTLVYSIVIILSVFIVQKEKINNFFLIGLLYLIYGLTTKDFTLYNIVNHINPFSIMTEFSELTFLTLVYKVTIAYLIYQLIVSIRQNTRRK